MSRRTTAAVMAIVLLLAGCGTDTYDSVSEEIDDLMTQEIPLSAEDRARIMSLRERAGRLRTSGESEQAVGALKQARQIIKNAADADLLRKSEG